MQSIPESAVHHQREQSKKSKKTSKCNKFSLSAILPQISHPLRETIFESILMSEPLPLLLAVSGIAFTAKPAYKLNITYGLEINAVHTASRLLEAKADCESRKRFLINQIWKSRIKQENTPKIRIAARQPMKLIGLILLHFCLGDY